MTKVVLTVVATSNEPHYPITGFRGLLEDLLKALESVPGDAQERGEWPRMLHFHDEFSRLKAVISQRSNDEEEAS